VPLEIPACLLRAVSLSWTAESDHGLTESPFTGQVQTQRGRIERWSFTMDIKRMSRRDAQQAIAFFLNLEGPLGTFRMHDPAACTPLGKATGAPVVTVDHAAGVRTVETTGWLPNVTGQLKAGDWVQLGDQLSRVRVDVDSDATGTASLDLWPKLMLPVVAGIPIITRPARGIFRFTSDLPSWDLDADTRNKPYTFRLTGIQEVLSP